MADQKPADRIRRVAVQLELFRVLLDQKTQDLADCIARHERSATQPEEVRLLAQEAEILRRLFAKSLEELQHLTGFTDDVLEAWRAAHLRKSSRDNTSRYTRRDIENVSPTGYLYDQLATGLNSLSRQYPAEWLKSRSAKPYQLGRGFREQPFHLVAGTKFEPGVNTGPHRLARMLLEAEALMQARETYDFYASPMLLAEVAALGNSLEEVKELGTEGQRKLSNLHRVDEAEMPSIIHELLVGAAFVRRGFRVECVEARPSRKSPDLRLLGSPVPVSIECKRRVGPSAYERAEAEHVEVLYQTIAGTLANQHCCLEVTFTEEVTAVDPTIFAEDVAALSRSREGAPVVTSWGLIRMFSLPPVVDVPRTRLYSSNYVCKVFGWLPLEQLWDGLLCQVEPPDQLMVDVARRPRCLKWSSVSERALIKKARGVTSLWAAAAEQIPAGHMGLIYIAYPEGGRPLIADARTQYIIDTAAKWHHRWQVNLPFTVVGRLYARAVGDGEPDFIENSMRMASPWGEETSEDFPADIFTPDWG